MHCIPKQSQRWKNIHKVVMSKNVLIIYIYFRIFHIYLKAANIVQSSHKPISKHPNSSVVSILYYNVLIVITFGTL